MKLRNEKSNPTLDFGMLTPMKIIRKSKSSSPKPPILEINLQNKDRQHKKDQNKLTEQKESSKTQEKLVQPVNPRSPVHYRKIQNHQVVKHSN
jgi:hypothetical protein